VTFKPTSPICNKVSKVVVALFVEKIKQVRKDSSNGHSHVISLENSPTSKEH
jgi:hypothetical protein